MRSAVFDKSAQSWKWRSFDGYSSDHSSENFEMKDDTMFEIQPERVQELRRARGISRSKLAKLSGVTERQIARLEGALQSKGAINAGMVQRIAAALQIQPETLLGDQPLTELDMAAAPQARSCSCCG